MASLSPKSQRSSSSSRYGLRPRPSPSSLEPSPPNKKSKKLDQKSEKSSNNNTGLQKSVANQTAVGLTLAKQLFLTEAKEKNMAFSPLSFHVVLSLITASEGSHHLEKQLLSFLKAESTAELNSLASDLIPLVLADGSHNGGPCLSFANGFWFDKSLPLESTFLQVADTFYKAALKQVDFKENAEEVRSEANAWAQEQTKGLIKEILPAGSVDPFTKFVFGNALYFKGVWADKFDPNRTKNYAFHLLDGTKIENVPYMARSDDQLVQQFDGFKVLRRWYKMGEDKDRDFSMYFFLPDANDGLPALLERVCSEPGFIDRHLPEKYAFGCSSIPRFKIACGFEACGGVLKDLGLELDKYKIHHKSFIEVNEEGTKAAAVTCGVRGYAAKGPIPKRVNFVADHPFMFLIMEKKTRAVLFIGQVLNPLEG